MVCEMCGGTDLIKKNGVFVCQSCGTKYSVEDARKMMIEGTVEVTGTVKVDSSNNLHNYVQLAERSLKALNYDEAVEFCNNGLVINPNDYKLLTIKGKILNAKRKGYEGNSLLEEAMHNCPSDNEKEAIIENISELHIHLSSEFLFTEYILFCIKKHKPLEHYLPMKRLLAKTDSNIGSSIEIKKLQVNTDLANIYWDSSYNKERMEKGVKYFLKSTNIPEEEAKKNVDSDVLYALKILNAIVYTDDKNKAFQVDFNSEFFEKMYIENDIRQFKRNNPIPEHLDLSKKTNDIIGFPFSITEDQVKNFFLEFLIKEKNISPNVVIDAEIKEVIKQYHVHYYCDGPYSAHWKATCVRTHTEEFMTTESKIVFVDKNGTEYSYQADGTTPVSKSVPKKDYKTVVDGVDLINRKESENYSCFVSGEIIDSPLSQWINKEFINEKSKIIYLDKKSLNQDDVIKHNNSGIAKKTADNRCKNTILTSVKNSMKSSAGTQYKDFTFDFNSDINVDAEVYIPIYNVTYLYNNIQYEVWFSGFKSNNCFSEKKPETNNKNVSKHLSIVAWISFGLCSLITIFAAFVGNTLPLSTMFNILFMSIGLFTIFAVCAITGKIFKKRSLKVSAQWTSIKKQFLNIQMTEGLEFSSKKQKMEQLLQQYSIKSIKNNPNGKIKSTQKTAKAKSLSNRFIVIIAILILIVASIICGIILYSNNANSNNSIVGRWQWDQNSSSTLTFTPDGKIISSNDYLANTYVVSDDKITVYSDESNTIIDTFSYKIKKNKLTFGKDNYTRIEHSRNSISINLEFLDNLGCTYGELLNKYGTVIENNCYNGGTYFIFKNNPGMYFFKDESGDTLFWDANGNCLYPNDNAECFYIRTRATDFFKNFKGSKLISDIEKELGVSIECYENEIDGGYAYSFEYKNYSIGIDKGYNNNEVFADSIIDIEVKF